ncbi:hypothetical protein FRB93_009149 [Tulasnella sp. JGI-2019a]|nr:hypothetical protein FRB93_009149 [Tulasnella sp. JGI-2019a]
MRFSLYFIPILAMGWLETIAAAPTDMSLQRRGPRADCPGSHCPLPRPTPTPYEPGHNGGEPGQNVDYPGPTPDEPGRNGGLSDDPGYGGYDNGHHHPGRYPGHGDHNGYDSGHHHPGGHRGHDSYDPHKHCLGYIGDCSPHVGNGGDSGGGNGNGGGSDGPTSIGNGR